MRAHLTDIVKTVDSYVLRFLIVVTVNDASWLHYSAYVTYLFLMSTWLECNLVVLELLGVLRRSSAILCDHYFIIYFIIIISLFSQ